MTYNVKDDRTSAVFLCIFSSHQNADNDYHFIAVGQN